MKCGEHGFELGGLLFTVPVGSRLRAKMKLLSSEPIDNNGQQMTWEVSIELEGASKPACVAESVARRYP